MKQAKVTYNKGFYIGDEVKYIDEIPLYLVSKGIVRLAIDSGLKYYKKGKTEEDLIIGTIDIKKDYRKPSAMISNMKELEELSEFEKINVYNSIGMWLHEVDLFYNKEEYITLFFYPITLVYKNFSLKVYPIIKFYHDGKMIISHNIYFNNKISFRKFGNIVCNIEIENIEGIELPTTFLNGIEYDTTKSYVRQENGEEMQFIYLENFKKINNFIDLSKFLLMLFGAKNSSNIFYSRILYLIDDKKLHDKEINKLLNGCMVETKETNIGKDFRLFKDYFHYQNDACTIIVGNNCSEHYPSIQSREEYIILQIMNDSIIFKNAIENKYTYNQLKDLRLSYMMEENHYACSPYSEVNDSIMNIFESMHKDIRIKNLNILLDEKAKEKEDRFQNTITLIALLLACQPITDYIVMPIICSIWNCHCYENILKPIMLLVSAIIIIIIYLIFKKKNIK